MVDAGIDLDAIDALTLAEEAGSSKAVNLVLMGRLSRYFDFTEEEWMTAIEASVPPKFLEMNKKAFALGRNA
jgi:indolepyruvate ferredoxin oxidoreductase beta subunit